MTDPYRVLGVSDQAGDEQIRAAYLAAVRECPPERNPARFELVRAAYESIATQRKRIAYELFDSSKTTAEDLVALLGEEFKPRLLSEAQIMRLLTGK